MKKEDIKVNVTYTPGYQQRFTEAIIKAVISQDKKRRKQETA